MRTPTLIVIFALLGFSVFSQSNLASPYDVSEVLQADTAFYIVDGQSRIIDHKFTFQFLDSLGTKMQLIDVEQDKKMVITVKDVASSFYQNMKMVGGADSMLVINFEAAMENFGPIGLTITFYNDRPEIFSISLGSRNRFLVVRPKRYVYKLKESN